jgi:hypothetical protein
MRPFKAPITTAKVRNFVRNRLLSARHRLLRGGGDGWAPVSRQPAALGIGGEDHEMGAALSADRALADLAIRLVSAAGERSAARGAACGS